MVLVVLGEADGYRLVGVVSLDGDFLKEEGEVSGPVLRPVKLALPVLELKASGNEVPLRLWQDGDLGKSGEVRDVEDGLVRVDPLEVSLAGLEVFLWIEDGAMCVCVCVCVMSRKAENRGSEATTVMKIDVNGLELGVVVVVVVGGGRIAAGRKARLPYSSHAISHLAGLESLSLRGGGEV